MNILKYDECLPILPILTILFYTTIVCKEGTDLLIANMLFRSNTTKNRNLIDLYKIMPIV